MPTTPSLIQEKLLRLVALGQSTGLQSRAFGTERASFDLTLSIARQFQSQ